MSTATFLVLGIVLAMVALVLSAVVSLPHGRRRARERGAPAAGPRRKFSALNAATWLACVSVSIQHPRVWACSSVSIFRPA